MKNRGSGILLHITSLPSPYGIGDMGDGAFRFVDFLAENHQSYWQILPLNPTSIAYGNSPYSSVSAFAGNPLLISPEQMVKHGFLPESSMENPPSFPDERVDYDSVAEYKYRLFHESYRINRDNLPYNRSFRTFCNDNRDWLDDYALFSSIRERLNGISWNTWPKELRDREAHALETWREKLDDEILFRKFLQHIFFEQLAALQQYCNDRKVKIIGDLPIYVNYDSCDVWTSQDIFSLDEEKKPVFITGVPPDYFSATGQLWGHPVYRWEVLRNSGYSWWIRRIEQNLRLFHMFRLDHFRGFVGFWKIRSDETTAINGEWVQAPAEDFFTVVQKHFPDISIIAEDLGVITPDVTEIMKKFGFPGMKVLLFAFGEDLPTNPYAPHNHIKDCVIYTGTHDNSTIKGWFQNELDDAGKKRLSEYIGHEVSEDTVNWDLIRLAMMSVADMVIVPMQDILGLGEKHRMNRPASLNGNWEWRLLPEQLPPDSAEKLRKMNWMYRRGFS